ncbi:MULTISPECIES: hypothetical protein [Bradyrhizobium]|nr:hypothetical protein [Bradyrhizobium elkanii]WLA50312.1 hypothetical protein QIH80_09150 [Bradyrhizobium elkanii]WLB79454.1 hypothetical protein QIH83_34835 [Bradyrhizobium elkanii]
MLIAPSTTFAAIGRDEQRAHRLHEALVRRGAWPPKTEEDSTEDDVR